MSVSPPEIMTPRGVTPGDVIDACDQALERLGILTMRLMRKERVPHDLYIGAIHEAAEARRMVAEFADS